MSKRDKEEGVARGAGCMLRGERGNGGIQRQAVPALSPSPAHAPRGEAAPPRG